MTLADTDVIRIIGKRQGSASYDVVTIIPTRNVKFIFDNTVISVPIPKTGNTGAVDVKLINLRRVKRSIEIIGHIYEESDGSALAVTTTNFDTNGTYTGGTNVPSVLKKKWMLEEMFMAGFSSGEGATIQWRGIKIPVSSPPASDETYNYYHKKVVITHLEIDNESSEAQDIDASSRIVPERMRVRMIVSWGNPQA